MPKDEGSGQTNVGFSDAFNDRLNGSENLFDLEFDAELDIPEKTLASRLFNSAKTGLQRMVDGLSATTPATLVANIGSKIISGKSLGDWVESWSEDAAARVIRGDISEADALQEVGQKSKEFVASMPDEDFGGPNGKSELLNEFDNNINSGFSGDQVSDQGIFSYDEGTRPLYNSFVNQWLDTALDAYTVQGTAISDAVNLANDNIGTYKANLSGGLDLFKDTTNAATAEQSGTLTGLQDKINSSLNLEPFKFSLLDQDVSFIPGANLDAAGRVADLGQTNLLNKTGTARDIIEAEGSTFQNLSKADQQRLVNSVLKAETGDGTLAFLDSFKDLSKLESANVATDKGIDINQQQLNQNEPGLLDYIKGVQTLFADSGDNGIFGKKG